MTPQRTVRLIVLMVAVAILLVELVHFLADGSERFREVYGGAIQVAYPEYYVDDVDATIGPISTSLEFSADEYGQLKAGYLHGSISMTALRHLSVSRLPNTKMTSMLQSFRGGQGAEGGVRAQARGQLAGLPDNAFATAIVELSEPLDERTLDTAFADFVPTKTDAVYLFLSGVEKGMKKPVFWRPCAIYRSDCEKKSSLELYRRWVSRLSWLDAIGFSQLDLDLNRLRETAREGRVYGLLTYGYPKPRLLEMMDMPEVRTIRIVETWTIG